MHPAASGEAGLPGEGGLTSRSVSKPDHSPLGLILLVTVGYFFSKETRQNNRV